ncbi:MAG: D-glycero-alpha-D-manno-heptose-1,7-bisphosphate 7-phosphatase [Luminiphilus sp.]
MSWREGNLSGWQSVRGMTSAVFLDRDGVINVDHGYVSTWEQFEFLAGVPEALRELQDADYLLIVVSNQSGIGRGYYSERDLHTLNQAIAEHLDSTLGVTLSGFYHCPHHPTEAEGEFRQQCDCRKPAPGMIQQAVLDHGIDVKTSLLVGDKDSDIEAGRAAGVARLFKVVDSAQSGASAPDIQFVTALSEVPSLL